MTKKLDKRAKAKADRAKARREARKKMPNDPIVKLAKGETPKRTRINPAVLARSRMKDKPVSAFSLPQYPPGVLPKGTDKKTHPLAMDEQIIAVNAWANQTVYASAFNNGATFLGYPYLAELAQIPEFRKITETIAMHMTRKFITLKSAGEGEEGEDKTQKIKELMDELDNFKVRDVFRRAAEVDGYFGRAHLYIDFGHQPREEMKMPIGNGRDALSRLKVARGSLKGFKVIEPTWTYPSSYNSNDPTTMDWYNPQSWFVMQKEIHSSRILKMVGHEVPDLLKPAYSFGGLSLTQMAKPYVDNWLRTRQSVADLVWSFSVSGVMTDLSTLMADDGEALFDRAELFNNLRNNRGMMMLNKDAEEFFQVNTPLGTLDKLQAQAQEHMASVSSIPLVFLLGITPSGLNASSEGEIRVFYDFISAYQEKLFKEPLTRVIDFIQLSKYGTIDPDIVFEFVPLWSMTEKEMSEIDKTNAETDDLRINGGVISPLEARKGVANDPDSRYEGLDTSVLPVPPGSSDDNGDGEIDPGEEPGPGGRGLDPGKPEGDEPPAPRNVEDDDEVFAKDEWKEGDHPRGQPGNAGQFGPGGHNTIVHNQEAGVHHVAHKGEIVKGKSGKNKQFLSPEAAQKFAETYTGEQTSPKEGKTKSTMAGGPSTFRKINTFGEYHQLAKASESELSPEEKTAVNFYTSPEYKPLNKALRSGKDLSPETKQMVDHLDNALSKSHLSEDVELYRGLTGSQTREMLDALMPGDTLTDKGYSSTGVHPQAVKDHIAGRGKGSMMVIRAPKGANAVFPGENSYNAQPNMEGGKTDSSLEAILPRGSKFKFVGKDKSHYVFELVPNGHAQDAALDEAQFEELKHPRDNKGQFAASAGGGSSGPKSAAHVAKAISKILSGKAGISNSYRNSIKELLQDASVSHEDKIKLKHKMIESYSNKAAQLVKAGDHSKAQAVAQKAAKLAASMGAHSPTPPKGEQTAKELDELISSNVGPKTAEEFEQHGKELLKKALNASTVEETKKFNAEGEAALAKAKELHKEKTLSTSNTPNSKYEIDKSKASPDKFILKNKNGEVLGASGAFGTNIPTMKFNTQAEAEAYMKKLDEPKPEPKKAEPLVDEYEKKKQEAEKKLSGKISDWSSLSSEDKDSLVDLQMIENNAEYHYKNAKESGPVQQGKISAVKAAHIFAYTGSAYQTTNKELRENHISEETWNHVRQLNDALKSLPAYTKKTTRGTTLKAAELAKWQPGKVVGDHGFMSTTKASEPSFGGNVVMEIEGKSGRDISSLSHHHGEQEVLFPAGTKFKIVSRKESYGKTHLTLKEV